MIGGALGRKMAAGHLSRRSPPLLRRMGWRAALVDKVMPGAGSSSTWRPPPLLRRSPWTDALVDKVVPGTGSSTPSPLSPDADSSKAVPLSPPASATTGVGSQGTDPTSSSMAVPPARTAAVGVGLHPVAHLSSMDVQVPPPPPDVAMGVGLHGSIDFGPDSDSSQAVPLPPPATTGFALQGTDPTSSVAVPPAPAPPAAVGVGHHSRRPLVPLLLFRSPRTPLSDMVVPGPGSPPQYGSPDLSSQPLLTSAGVDLTIVNELNSPMRFPLRVSDPELLFIQENGLRGFRRSPPHRGKVSSTMTAAYCGDRPNAIIANQQRLTNKSPTRATVNRLQLRCYSKETRIPLIPSGKVLPPPPPPPCDLTTAPQFCSASSPSEKRISQEIMAASYVLNNVLEVMKEDKNLVGRLLDVNALKTMFEEYKVEALEMRGLLCHHPLEDTPFTRLLHLEYELIVGTQQVIHLSTWRLMEILRSMPRDFWNPLLDFLSSKRALIYIDWKVELTTWISFSVYDFGVECAPDNISWYKSESDASFNQVLQKCDIGVLIWKDRKVVWCEIYKDFPCRSSVEAEATGMYLQLRRSVGLDYLKAHTDNNTIRNVVGGKLIAGKDEEETKLFKLLQVLTGYFRRVVPRWVPREEVKFVDGLLRNPQVMDQIGHSEHSQMLGQSVVNQWKPHLRGEPIFAILPGKGFSLGNFKGNFKFKYQDTCFLIVKEERKTDGVYHVIHALCPSVIHIVTNKAQAEELFDDLHRLSDMFGVLISREKESNGWTTFKMQSVPRFRARENTRDLVIVLDSSLPKESYLKEESFTVFLVTESEKKNIGCEIPKFSPLSFVSFHQFISKSSVESS